MNRQRLCHVIHNTEAGGAETMLYEIVKRLRHRHDMTVVSLLECGAVGHRLRELGIQVIPMQWSRGRIPRMGQFAKLVNTLRAIQPQIVQTWTYHADLCGGLAARMATRAKVYWNIRHGSLDPRIDSKNVLRSARLCGLLSRWVPDGILINSEAALDVHIQAGYQPSKLQWIPNGFDTRKFAPDKQARDSLRGELKLSEQTPLVGMCGRFHPHKGQQAFVDVAQRIVRSVPFARFLVAGSDCVRENETLSQWITAAGLDDRFHLLGCRQDMPQILNAIDLYLLPSVTEGMPNIVGESLACGTPVVAFDVGDVRRLLQAHGAVVAAGDTAGMAAAAITQLRQSPRARADMARQGRSHIVQNFDVNTIAARYEAVWDGALPSSSGAGGMRPVSPPNEARVASQPKLMHVSTIGLTPWLFLRGQNQYMKAQGFDVHVASSPGRFLDKLRERDQVTTHPVAISRQIQPLADMAVVAQLWRLFRKVRPEIVQLSTPKAALLGAIAAKAAGVPVRIYQVRGLSSESESGFKRWLFQRLERLTARLCNGHLVNADSLLRYAQRTGILQAGLVAGEGMSNGVDTGRFQPQPTDLPTQIGPQTKPGPVIGYVGRLTKDKGIEDLYEAWKILRQEFPTARLTIVGPWEEENAIKSDCRRAFQEDPRVQLHGLQEDVVPYYRSMDIFTYPSHGTEGFPNAPMEAAAMGLPVIATNVVGCVDAVADGETGVIVPPRSPRALTDALRNYLADASLRKKHGDAGCARIQTRFTPERLWVEFRHYYGFLLRREGLLEPLATETVVPPRRAAA